MAQRDRVVILGGGFGGVGAARKLKGVDADVVLIDRHDYHTFSPMLYQVATDLVDPATVGHPLRDLFHEQPNVVVHQTTATTVDLAARSVSFEDMAPITYDYLVLGLGAVVNFFGGPDAAAYPSLVDPGATDPNFRVTDDTVDLYYVVLHYNAACQVTNDRDLVRVPIQFSP